MQSLPAFAAVAVFALASPACGEVADPQTVASYQVLVAQDLRLATIGYRLASANAPFCQKKSRQPGWVLHDIRQYPDAIAARAAFEFHAPVSIAAVVPGGPAERAGVEAADGLQARNSDAWDWAKSTRKQKPWGRLEAVKAELDGLFETGSGVRLELKSENGSKNITLVPELVCASQFWVDPRAKLDAGADGERVRITSAMIDYATDDDELAAVAAHEMAHNLLDHRPRIRAAKKGKVAVTRETEIEADRLSVWLMANAGYDPAAAIRFWKRYGPKTDAGIFSAPTHLRWRNRIGIFENEIAQTTRTPMIGNLRPPPLLAAAEARQ